MQTSLIQRSRIFSRPYFLAASKNVQFDNSRFQSSSSDNVAKSLLPENVRSFPYNPFRLYINMWRMSRYQLKYEKTFRLDEFHLGAKKAFIVVSKKLYDGDLDGLRGLVSDEVINQLRPAVENLDAERREMFNLQEDDIYGQFLLDANFRQAAGGENFFDIFLAMHCFRQLEGQKPALRVLMENKEKFVWANARFSRRLFESSVTDWTITYLNYARM